MQFLKWMTRPKKEKPADRIKILEEQNALLFEQLSKQNTTLQEVVVCIRRLAEVDQSMYKDILAIANIITGLTAEDPFGDNFYNSIKKEDEYLN